MIVMKQHFHIKNKCNQVILYNKQILKLAADSGVFLSGGSGLSLMTYFLFLPQHHLDAIHRHNNADLLLLDVLGFEFILRNRQKHWNISIIYEQYFMLSV